MTTMLKQDAKLADFAVLAYNKDGGPTPEGWEKMDYSKDGSFAAYAYRNKETNEIVIAFRGTDDLGDWTGANQDILRGKWTPQMSLAMEFVNKVRNSDAASDTHIYVTGHSLGGALAQLSSQMFGLDGMTLDPLAAEKLLHTPEFRKYALELTQNPQGLGMPESFVNYGVTDSFVSNATGKQLGQLQPVPGMDLPGKELGKAAVVAAIIHPVAGMASLIASDQIGSKHSSIPGSQTVRMLAEAVEQDALNHGNLFSGKIHFEQVIRHVPGPMNQEAVQKVSNEVLLKNEQGEAQALFRFHGGVDDRELDIFTPDGKQMLYRIHDPQTASDHAVPPVHDAARSFPQQGGLTVEQREILMARIQENISNAYASGSRISVTLAEIIDVCDVPEPQSGLG